VCSVPLQDLGMEKSVQILFDGYPDLRPFIKNNLNKINRL